MEVEMQATAVVLGGGGGGGVGLGDVLESEEEREARVRRLFAILDQQAGYLDHEQIEAGLAAMSFPGHASMRWSFWMYAIPIMTAVLTFLTSDAMSTPRSVSCMCSFSPSMFPATASLRPRRCGSHSPAQVNHHLSTPPLPCLSLCPSVFCDQSALDATH